MVLISSKKYACETCIKGHRSSTCKHTDRPLYEIKKKGRPVTQCEHCRELRKTKQVHVKCICEVKSDNSFLLPSSNGKKGTKIPQCAAFPNGLPQELEVVVASQLAQEGSASDPCHGGMQLSLSVKEHSSCECKSGAPCTCWTPRNSFTSHDSTGISYLDDTAETASGGSPQTRLSMSHILARVKELRPVLPRPTRSSPPNGGPIHELSSGMPHSIPNRHHIYDHVMFSPYGRAHDRTHDHPLGHEKQNLVGLPTSYVPDGLYERPILELAASGSQAERLMSIGRFSFTSACTCGDPCRCTGCEQNKSVDMIPALDANCASNACQTCLECSYFNPLSSSTIQQRSDQRVAIDEWLRQVSTPASENTCFQQTFIKQEYTPPLELASQNMDINEQSDSNWDNVARSVQPSNSSDDGHTHVSAPDHCGALGYTDRLGQLQMSPGMSRSDTHLVLPDFYQTRPLSAPLQRNLGGSRSSMSNIADLPYSASLSALDVTGGDEYVSNAQLTMQALVDFAIASNDASPSGTSLALPWMTGNDEGNPLSTPIPAMYPYAVSNSGTDGTSSYDDLSTTLRTPL